MDRTDSSSPIPPLRVLHRDEHLVAVDKPAGLFSHPSPLDRRAPSVLAELRATLGQRVYGVHRLDRPTSGVLLFALSSEAASALCDAFRRGLVRKGYRAVVRGFVAEEGVVDHPVREEGRGPGRAARTSYRRLATATVDAPVGPYPTARYSLVEVRPATGRRHQIRQHFAHLRHPLVGDTVYGDGRHNRLFRERFDLGRLLLFATELSLEHPFGGAHLTLAASLPAGVRPAFEALGWGAHLETREGPRWAPLAEPT